MKKKILLTAALALSALMLPGKSEAIIANPNPAVWANDDGSTIFAPSALTGNIEIYDLFGAINGSGTFGFYFNSTPGTHTTIFGTEDQGGAQSALVNFGTGVVFDVDASTLQSLFATSGSPIGFYYSFVAGDISHTYFTEPSLNPFSLDLAATFPSLTNPHRYLLGFETPGSAGLQAAGGTLLYLEIVNGVTPVPEPSTLALLLTGVAGAGLYLRKRSKGC